MTTFDPGASEVFTHGRRSRPFSTAFRASSAAPIITDGFEVLVHEVIAAIVTAPWSSSSCVPSARVTGTGLRRAAARVDRLAVDPRAVGVAVGVLGGRVGGRERLAVGLLGLRCAPDPSSST